MNKRAILWVLMILFSAIIISAIQWFRPSTTFTQGTQKLIIKPEHSTPTEIIHTIQTKGLLKRTSLLGFALQLNAGGRRAKHGRYRIKAGMSQWDVYRVLVNGKQEAVPFVITKYRTRSDFSRQVGRVFGCDSSEMMQFLQSPDSLEPLGMDTNIAMACIIPNTYELYWGSSAGAIYRRLLRESKAFWTQERIAKAEKLGLKPLEVYVLASIIEEETNLNADKPLIASVYLNRMKKGMTLSADPTVKFALQDFGIKRIMLGHIQRAGDSPYNTYKRKGLPPGPICTPSVASIDAVLEGRETNYLFFCATPDFSGRHAFAATEMQHFRNARAYRAFLDSLYRK